jgi:quinol monooxygenase YgiN
MPNVYVVATARIRPEALATFASAAKLCVDATRREAGCVRYDVHASVTEPNTYVFVEEWASRHAVDVHFAAPHTTAFLAVAADCVAEPPTIEIIMAGSVVRR